jgi:hypothetical protein
MVDLVDRARVFVGNSPARGLDFFESGALMQSQRFMHKCFKRRPFTNVARASASCHYGVRPCKCGKELREGPFSWEVLLRCSQGGMRTLTHDGIWDVRCSAFFGRPVTVSVESLGGKGHLTSKGGVIPRAGWWTWWRLTRMEGPVC